MGRSGECGRGQDLWRPSGRSVEHRSRTCRSSCPSVAAERVAVLDATTPAPLNFRPGYNRSLSSTVSSKAKWHRGNLPSLPRRVTICS